MFAQRIRRCRRGRGQQKIRLLKTGVKRLLDERLHLKRLIIVGIVIARGQRERAEHDAPLDLRAESFASRRQIQVVQIFIFLRTETVFHAVITGQVAARLRARQNVIRRYRIIEHRHIHRHKHRAQLFQNMRRIHHALAHIFRQTLAEIRLRNTDAQPIKPLFFRNHRRRHIHARRVQLVLTHQHSRHRGGVPRINRQRSDLIQRRRIRQQPIARNRAIRRLDARHAAERRRLAD